LCYSFVSFVVSVFNFFKPYREKKTTSQIPLKI
jgi:hypothetical protein